MSEVIEAYRSLGLDFNPNKMQQRLFDIIRDGDPAHLLMAGTGSGKTEAVAVPVLYPDPSQQRRLVMVLPARSLVEDLRGRMSDMLCALSRSRRRSCALIVDVGGEWERISFQDGQEVRPTSPREISHYYSGDVILTTLDKFIYRFFAYGPQRKSYVFPYRIHEKLQQSIFCFDEAHCYDGVAFTNFLSLIRALYEKGLKLIVMTATMPEEYQKELTHYLDPLDHLSESGNPKRNLTFAAIDADPEENEGREAYSTALVDAFVHQIEERASAERRTIVVVETVEDAAKVFTAVKQQGRGGFFYHGRLPNEQRRKVYGEIKRRDTDNNGYLLITTSAIEVGCDLDAHTLITELCNPEQLIQRAGRCNRRAKMETGEVVVIGGKHIRPWLRTMGESEEQVYLDYLKIPDVKPYSSEELIQYINKTPNFDYRAQILFDMLYEFVYEFRLENEPLHKKGLVITRSWEPTVTLTTDRKNLKNAVTVPIGRLALRKDLDEKRCEEHKLYYEYYDRGEGKKIIDELSRNVSAYFADLILEVPKESYDPELGYVEIPRVLHREYRPGYHRALSYVPDDELGKNKPQRYTISYCEGALIQAEEVNPYYVV